MKDTAASWINDIIYISFKRLSLFDFCNNLYSFLRMYMDIFCVGVYSFFDSTITQLFKYEPFADSEQTQKIIPVTTALLREIYVKLSESGQLHKVLFCESDKPGPEAAILALLRERSGCCLHLPLDYGDLLGGFRFINLYADQAGVYTAEQRRLCETLRLPLRNALTDALQRRECAQAGLEMRQPVCPVLQESAAPYGSSFKTLNEWTAEYIRAVIRHTNGRISGKNGAAALLGLPPTTLWSKMRKLKIHPRQQ